MYSSSGGSAQMAGYDIATRMDEIRYSLGICPQHNMLFPELTVMEHFYIFGMVRFYTNSSWGGREYGKLYMRFL